MKLNDVVSAAAAASCRVRSEPRPVVRPAICSKGGVTAGAAAAPELAPGAKGQAAGHAAALGAQTGPAGGAHCWLVGVT